MKWFQFCIRDVLWLTTVCAVLVSWWNDRMQLRARLDESVSRQQTVIENCEQTLQANREAIERDLGALAETARIGQIQIVRLQSLKKAIADEFGARGLLMIEEWSNGPQYQSQP